MVCRYKGLKAKHHVTIRSSRARTKPFWFVTLSPGFPGAHLGSNTRPFTWSHLYPSTASLLVGGDDAVLHVLLSLAVLAGPGVP